jgi:hypothetical protein
MSNTACSVVDFTSEQSSPIFFIMSLNEFMFPLEKVTQNFKKVKVRSKGTTLEDATVYITSHRAFAFKDNKISFEIKSVDIKKAQQKLVKGDTNDKSEATCRLILGENLNIDYSFKGKDCNLKCLEYIKKINEFRKTVPPPIVEEENQIQESELTVEILRSKNPILSMMCADDRYKDIISSDTLNIFDKKLVENFAKNNRKRVGFSNKDQVTEALRADTSAGANYINYKLDDQIIRQLLKRRPALLKLYRESGKSKEEFFKTDYIKYIQEDSKNYDHNVKTEKNMDISRQKPEEEEKRFQALDIKARLDNLYDNNPTHGLMNKDNLKPYDQAEVIERHIHSQLALMETGIVPDTTQDPNPKVQHIDDPIQGAHNLLDLFDSEEKVIEDLEIKEEAVSEDAVFSQITKDEWLKAAKAFDRQLESLQEKRKENPDEPLIIDEFGCMNVLSEMTHDRTDVHQYEAADFDYLNDFAEKTAVLQILANTYWDSEKSDKVEKRKKADKVKEVVLRHKTETEDYFNSLEQEVRNRMEPLMNNLKNMYSAIIDGTDQVRKHKVLSDTIILL